MPSSLVKFSPPTFDFVLRKQLEYRKEKNRVVSLAYTVERLIKEAYLKREENARG